VLPVWRIVEDADRGVVHFVVSDHKQAWVENGFLLTVLGGVASPWDASEMLLSEVNKLLVADSSCAYNNHVVAEVVGVLKVDDHVSVDLADVVDISEDGLAHHVFSVNVIVDVFHQGFL